MAEPPWERRWDASQKVVDESGPWSRYRSASATTIGDTLRQRGYEVSDEAVQGVIDSADEELDAYGVAARLGADALGLPRAVAPVVAGIDRLGDLTQQGFFLGARDELAGAGEALAGRRDGESAGDAFRRGRRTLNRQFNDARRTQPVSAAVAELAGGVGSAPAVAGALRVAPGGTTFLGRTAQAGTVGAAAGAAYDNEDPLRGALFGGLLSAGVNAALEPLARTVAGARARTAAQERPRIAERTAGGEADDAAGMAVKRMRGAINPETERPWTPAEIEAHVRHLRAYGGPIEETLLDLPGLDRVQGLGSATANVQGPGKEIIRRTLIERLRGAPGAGGGRVGFARDELQGAPRRIVDRALTQLTSGREQLQSGASFARASRQMLDDLRAQTGPIFDRVSDVRIDPALFRTAFFELFEDPNVGRAWRRTARAGLNQVRGKAGRGLQRALRALSQGEMPADEDLTIGLLHRLRRALNDEIGVATRAGNNELASDLTQLRRDYFDEWIRDSGQAGQDLLMAINTYADERALLRARDAGEKIFTMNDGELWALIDGASEPERAAMVMGSVRQIQRLAGRFETGRPAIREILRPDNRERLRAIWPTDARGTDQPFERFLYRVARENNMLETYNRAMTGSRTTPLKENIADATVRDAPIGEVLDQVEEAIRQGSGPRQLLQRGAADALGRARNPGIYNERTNRAVAELLTTPLSANNPQGRSIVTERLRQELARQRLRRALAGRLQSSARGASGLPAIAEEQLNR